MDITVVILAIAIIVLSAAALMSRTKGALYFYQDVDVGVGSKQTIWASLGTQHTRFGWKRMCWRHSTSDSYQCQNYRDIDFHAAEILDWLGWLTYVGWVFSVALAALLLLTLATYREAPGLKDGTRMTMAGLSALVAALFLSVTLVSMRIYVGRLLHEEGVADRIKMSWIYWDTALAFVCWLGVAVFIM